LDTALFIARRIRKANKKAFTTLVQQIGTVSVALGLATFLIAFLVINGFKKNVEDKLTNFQGQYQVFKYSLSRSIEEPPIATNKVQGIQEAFPNYIQAIQAFIHKTVLVQTKEALEGIVLKGVEIQANFSPFTNCLVAGKFMTAGQPKYNHEIVLSTTTAAKLNVQVGEQVTICILQQTPRYRKLKVVGLYTTHLEELDEKIALCDIRLLQHLNNWPDNLVGGYDLFLKEPCSHILLTDKLLDWLGYDLDVRNIEQSYPTIFDWLAMMRKDVLIYLILILLVANSNIISIVLIQVMERTNMIGLLKTMGATDSLIYRILLWNNMYLIIKGMLWGNVIGIGLAALQYHFKLLHLDPTYYYIAYVPIVWDFRTIIAINLLLFMLVSAVLIVAISIIAKVKPIKSIQLR
jgi:lipoprotein-releasing system permease protein